MIRNINSIYGDCVEFDSVDEMIDAINQMADQNEDFDSVEYLEEGIDYEVVE
jgi:hypothetical protein